MSVAFGVIMAAEQNGSFIISKFPLICYRSNVGFSAQGTVMKYPPFSQGDVMIQSGVSRSDSFRSHWLCPSVKKNRPQGFPNGWLLSGT